MEYTKEQLIELVDKISKAEGTEEEIDCMIDKLQRVFPCAAITNLIFWDNKTPEEVIEAAMECKPIIAFDRKIDDETLLLNLQNLYDTYGVDKSVLNEQCTTDIKKKTKGYLAILDKEKNKEYSKEDSVLIQEIYYLFC